jgi:hypothetical protein
VKYWLLVALVACKSKAPPPKVVDDAKPAIDWAKCDAALQQAASAPLDARPLIVIDGCQVCGDWTPILKWATPEGEGGPKFAAIEATMQRCGFCDGNAKQRFLGTLDKARGTDTRTPWRQLGDVCKADVSAVPDNRFMSAPYYALDRIARAAGARGGETASRLALLELPLPALSISGTGVVLPELDTQVTPKVGTVHVSLIGDQIFVGKLPRARLSASGVTVTTDYPGTQVAIGELASTVEKLVVGDPTSTVTRPAPHALPA